MIDEATQYFYGGLYNFARCYGFLAFFPFGQMLSAQGLKLTCAITFSLLFSHTIQASAEFSILLFAGQFLLGLALSLPFLVLLEFLIGAGEIVDAMRGQTIAIQYNPLSSGLESVSSQFLRPFLTCLILQVGFMEQSARMLSKSFSVMPVSQTTFGSAGFSATSDVTATIADIVALVVESGAVGITTYLPLALLFVAVDFLAAALQTVLPQTNLLNDSFLLKTGIAGLFIIICVDYGLFSSWALTAVQLPTETLVAISGGVK